jgi:hypothetical protein
MFRLEDIAKPSLSYSSPEIILRLLLVTLPKPNTMFQAEGHSILFTYEGGVDVGE